MSKSWSRHIPSVLVVVAILAVLAWVVMSMHYVPKAEHIRDSNVYQPFLIEASAIAGIYGNMDVDSEVFRYITSVSEDKFWAKIDANLMGTDWKPLPPLGNVRRFQRQYDPDPPGSFYSLEELRVAYRPGIQQITIAWVQADSSKPVGKLEECSEWDFAEKWLFPKMQEP